MTATCEREGECNCHPLPLQGNCSFTAEIPCEGWQEVFCALVEQVADDDADDYHILKKSWLVSDSRHEAAKS